MLGGAIHPTATLASTVFMVAMVARVAMAALAALAAAMPTVTITVMATAKGVEHGCLGLQLLSSALACIGPIKPIASRLSL